MMLVLVILCSADSVPPLPDLSKIIFPEPPLYVQAPLNRVHVDGLYGHHTSAAALFDMSSLHINGHYTDASVWDTIQYAHAGISYAIPFPGLWLRPMINGMFYNRDVQYELLSPQLDFSSTNPWSILYGSFEADVWSIDSEYHIEQTTKFELIFDKTLYLPHLSLESYYINNNIKTIVSSQLHIRSLHIEIGSPVNSDFPSPRVVLAYLQPRFFFTSEVYSGTLYHTLKEFFNPEIPLQYTRAVPYEKVAVGSRLTAGFHLNDHDFVIEGAYNNWQKRLIAGSHYSIGIVEEVQEVNLVFKTHNSIFVGNCILSNSMHVQHTWSDTTLVFEPKYSLQDSFSVRMKAVGFGVDARYLSERQGLETSLPACFIMDVACGLYYKCIGAIVECKNVSDTHHEFFNGYFLVGRQFAAGLVFDISF
jgi:hypothetical protein